MRQIYYIVFFVITLSATLSAQKNATDVLLIANGRAVFMDYIDRNELDDAEELFTNLYRDYEGSKYVAFITNERWMAYFALGKSPRIIKEMKLDKKIERTLLYGGISYYYSETNETGDYYFSQNDGFSGKMRIYINNNRKKIEDSIEHSVQLVESEKDFLKLLLLNIVYSYENVEISRDSINILSLAFIDKYGKTPAAGYLADFVEKNILFLTKISNWSWGMKLGYMQGIPSGEIGKYLTAAPGIIASFELSYKKWMAMFDADFIFAKAKKNFMIDNDLVRKSNSIIITNLNVLFGYSFFDKPEYRITPFIGAAFSSLEAVEQDSLIVATSPDLQNPKIKFTPNFALGTVIDFKIPVKGNIDNTYIPVSLRYNYNFYTFDNKVPQLKGGMNYLSLTLGIVIRKAKKIDEL